MKMIRLIKNKAILYFFDDLRWISGIVVGAVFGTLTFFFGTYDLPLQVLVSLVIADYITGLMAAWQTRSLSSKMGAKGIAKKIGYFVLVGLAFQLDKLFNIEPLLRTTAIWTLSTNEVLSNIENLKIMGVPIPEYLTDKIKAIKGELDKGGVKGEGKKPL